METAELLEAVARGEDSKHQFKADATNANSLGAEMVAFANAGGGQIFIGVSNDGTLQPHDQASVRRLNELIANASSNCVRPPVNPVTENVPVQDGVVVVVSVAEGLSKPYMDNSGAFWVKAGSDKRRVTSREEIQRMFQTAQLLHGDDVRFRVPRSPMSILITSEGSFEPVSTRISTTRHCHSPRFSQICVWWLTSD
jgi:ATP-dependent DNA helicase RecG